MGNAIDLVLLLLDHAATKSVTGRTLLQKQAYFANEIANLKVEFTAHFYGPFSRRISQAVDTLVGSGLVRETVEEFPGIGPSIWERRRYTYKLTPMGEELTPKVRERQEKAAPKIREVIKAIEASGLSKDYLALAAASKVHYIVKRSRKPLRVPRISEEAKRVGWSVAAADIKKVIHFLESLHMVRRVTA